MDGADFKQPVVVTGKRKGKPMKNEMHGAVTARMLATETGIAAATEEQSAAYLGGWIKALKAVDYIHHGPKGGKK